MIRLEEARNHSFPFFLLLPVLFIPLDRVTLDEAAIASMKAVTESPKPTPKKTATPPKKIEAILPSTSEIETATPLTKRQKKRKRRLEAKRRSREREQEKNADTTASPEKERKKKKRKQRRIEIEEKGQSTEIDEDDDRLEEDLQRLMGLSDFGSSRSARDNRERVRYEVLSRAAVAATSTPQPAEIVQTRLSVSEESAEEMSVMETGEVSDSSEELSEEGKEDEGESELEEIISPLVDPQLAIYDGTAPYMEIGIVRRNPIMDLSGFPREQPESSHLGLVLSVVDQTPEARTFRKKRAELDELMKKVTSSRTHQDETEDRKSTGQPETKQSPQSPGQNTAASDPVLISYADVMADDGKLGRLSTATPPNTKTSAVKRNLPPPPPLPPGAARKQNEMPPPS